MLALRGKGRLPGAVSQRGLLGSQQGAPRGAAARRGWLGGARRAGCSRARAGACTCVCTVGRCRACARHGPDARHCGRWTPAHRRPAPPGENTAQNPGLGAAELRPEKSSRRAGPGLRPAVERANAEPQHLRRRGRRAGFHAPQAELEPSGLAPARAGGARNRQRPGALPARSGEPQCGRVLRGIEGAWPDWC